MKRLLTAAAVFTAVVLTTASAQAATTVVTFDELKHDQVVKLHRINPLTSGGLVFTTSDRAQGFASWGTHTGNADPTGATLMNWSGNATVTIGKVGGGLFQLASLDMADIYNTGLAEPVEFTFFDGVRTVTETVTLDRIKGMQTLAFNRTVEWFSFKVGGAGSAQFDNVTWGDPVVSGVPEPASWAMMIIGFASIGGMVRRSRRTARAVLA